LEFGTGGPKQHENLYTRAMIQQAFSSLMDMSFVEDELEMQEGTADGGMSAVIIFTPEMTLLINVYVSDCPA